MKTIYIRLLYLYIFVYVKVYVYFFIIYICVYECIIDIYSIFTHLYLYATCPSDKQYPSHLIRLPFLVWQAITVEVLLPKDFKSQNFE